MARGTALNADRVYYAASLFKLAVLYEAHRQRAAGRLDFAERLVVQPRHLEDDLGTADRTGIAAGDALPVGWLLEQMIVVSDNVSAVLLLERLGSANVDAGLRALGLKHTSVADEGLPTTAGDVALLLEAIATGQAVSPAASAEMEALLRHQAVRDRIPAGLPSDLPVGNKTGNWENAVHDAAIVYAPSGTYVLVVLSDGTGGNGPIVRLSERVFAYYAAQLRPDGSIPV